MSSLAPSLRLTHLPFADISKSQTNHILGAIHFTEACFDSALACNDFPNLNLAAHILQGHEMASELLMVEDSPTVLSHQGHIQYRSNSAYLFGVITLPEFADTADASGLQLSTEQAYNEIFELMAALDYPYIYRFWNYITDINGVSQNLERYWQFNAGRKDAFTRHADTIGAQYPAACALGLSKGPLSIAFLLGRETVPIAIENPRQVSAYEYPEQYGPRTPSFSRATLLKSSDVSTLFISGTASIVGHETYHLNDPAAQARETMVNLQIVLDQANQQLDKPLFKLNELFLRVYVRNAQDLPLIKQAIQDHLNATCKAIYILADICRQDLLLEIEAIAQADISQMNMAQVDLSR
jgi:chorismate lyase/3-hydroxybenzoate synthase